MHQHFSRTVISLYFAVHTDRPVALKTEELQFDVWVNRAITDDFWLLGQLSSFVFMLQFVIVMRLVTRNTQIGIFSFTILPGNIVLAKFAGNFLA